MTTARLEKPKNLQRKGSRSKLKNHGETAVLAEGPITVHGYHVKITITSTGSSHTGEQARGAVWTKVSVTLTTQIADVPPATPYASTVDKPVIGRINAPNATGTVTAR